MTDGKAVEAQGLRKTYRTGGKEVQALRGVNLEVERGKVVCLLGPNGAGKTTLVKILATLLLPDGGWARVAGLDVVSQGNEVRKIMGYAGQDSERSAYFRLTARENLLFFSKTFHGMGNAEANERIAALADALGFTEKLDGYFITLSGGEKQMFVIMRALIAAPEIVFMDEPSKSLDPIAASCVRSYLKDYARHKNAALLVTTHNMKEAEDISDNVIMVNKGEVLFNGTPEGMKASVMKTEVVQIGGNHIDEGVRRAIAGIPGVTEVHDEGRDLRLYCNNAYEVLPRVIETLKMSGHRVPVGMEYLTLDEAFRIMVTGGTKQ